MVCVKPWYDTSAAWVWVKGDSEEKSELGETRPLPFSRKEPKKHGERALTALGPIFPTLEAEASGVTC